MWSYDPAQSRTLDTVRFLVGDTLADQPLLQDEEIDYLLTLKGSPIRAAALAAESIAASFSRMGDLEVDGLSQRLSQRVTQYQDLARRLRREASMGGVSPFAGGISEAQKDLEEQDVDRVMPSFSRSQQQEPGTEEDTAGDNALIPIF